MIALTGGAAILIPSNSMGFNCGEFAGIRMGVLIGKNIAVKGTSVRILANETSDYISLTDIASHRTWPNGSRYSELDEEPQYARVLRDMGAIEQSGIQPHEFEGFRKMAGMNSFVLTPRQWIIETNAIGIVSKPGRNGGTFAHKDIAFEFASETLTRSSFLEFGASFQPRP